MDERQIRLASEQMWGNEFMKLINGLNQYNFKTALKMLKKIFTVLNVSHLSSLKYFLTHFLQILFNVIYYILIIFIK